MSEPESVDENESERRQSFRLDMEKELVDIIWVNDKQQQHFVLRFAGIPVYRSRNRVYQSLY